MAYFLAGTTATLFKDGKKVGLVEAANPGAQEMRRAATLTLGQGEIARVGERTYAQLVGDEFLFYRPYFGEKEAEPFVEVGG